MVTSVLSVDYRSVVILIWWVSRCLLYSSSTIGHEQRQSASTEPETAAAHSD